MSKKEIAEFFELVYLGLSQAKTLFIPLYISTGKSIWERVKSGYRMDFDTVRNKGDYRAMTKMHNNVWLFSGSKTLRETRDLAKLITDSNGNLRPFKDFRKDAAKIHTIYNDNWLKAERQMAFDVAQSARQWDEFQAAKGAFPFLKYQTQEDSHVRQSHRILNDVVRHIDDPFWNTHNPPLDWRCRCNTTALMQEDVAIETPIPEHAYDKEVLNPLFAFNAGKRKVIFDKKHPYFKEAADRYPYLKKMIPQPPEFVTQ